MRLHQPLALNIHKPSAATARWAQLIVGQPPLAEGAHARRELVVIDGDVEPGSKDSCRSIYRAAASLAPARIAPDI